MIHVVVTTAGILRPRYGSSTARPMTGLSSMSLWIIISVIGGITVVAIGLVIGVLCYRKCTKKQQPSHQNVYVLIYVRTQTAVCCVNLGSLLLLYSLSAHIPS